MVYEYSLEDFQRTKAFIKQTKSKNKGFKNDVN